MLATAMHCSIHKQIEQLALANPVGLEDWKGLGVPYRTVDQWSDGKTHHSSEHRSE